MPSQKSKKQIEQEVLTELRKRIAAPEPPPAPPPPVTHSRVEDPGLDRFFELAAEEKEKRRGR